MNVNIFSNEAVFNFSVAYFFGQFMNDFFDKLYIKFADFTLISESIGAFLFLDLSSIYSRSKIH